MASVLRTNSPSTEPRTQTEYTKFPLSHWNYMCKPWVFILRWNFVDLESSVWNTFTMFTFFSQKLQHLLGKFELHLKGLMVLKFELDLKKGWIHQERDFQKVHQPCLCKWKFFAFWSDGSDKTGLRQGGGHTVGGWERTNYLLRFEMSNREPDGKKFSTLYILILQYSLTWNQDKS